MQHVPTCRSQRVSAPWFVLQDEAIAQAHRSLADRDAAIAALQAAGKAAEGRIAALTLQAISCHPRNSSIHAVNMLKSNLECAA